MLTLTIAAVMLTACKTKKNDHEHDDDSVHQHEDGTMHGHDDATPTGQQEFTVDSSGQNVQEEIKEQHQHDHDNEHDHSHN